jgi:hypothetical protein
VSRFSIDDLLKGLGVPRADAPKETSPEPPVPAAPAPIDAASAPLPLSRQPISPSMDAPRPPDMGGEGFGTEVDGAIAARAEGAGRVTRPDEALNEIYVPAARTGPRDLATLLVERGAVDPERMTSAQRVVKQTPGKKLSQALIELGVDEAAVQAAVAELARLPFERIDLKAKEPFDQRSMVKLGQDYCRQKLVVPLRQDGSRIVVATASPDDVFLLDDVKRRLGVPTIKHVLVPAGDIIALLQSISESEASEVDVDEILANVDEEDVEVEQEERPRVPQSSAS